MKYGRENDEWNKLVDATTDYLIDIARGRRLTTYTELSTELANRTGYARFEYELPRDQAAVGALLGEVTDRTLDEIGAMLSSLVVQKATGDPGEGFYRFARKLGVPAARCRKVRILSVAGSTSPRPLPGLSQ